MIDFFRNLKVIHVLLLISNDGIKKADPEGLCKKTSKFGLDATKKPTFVGLELAYKGFL